MRLSLLTGRHRRRQLCPASTLVVVSTVALALVAVLPIHARSHPRSSIHPLNHVTTTVTPSSSSSGSRCPFVDPADHKLPPRPLLMFKNPHTGSSWMAELLQDLLPSARFFHKEAVRPLAVQNLLESTDFNFTSHKVVEFMTKNLFIPGPRFGNDGGDDDDDDDDYGSTTDTAAASANACFVGYSMAPPHVDGDLNAPLMDGFEDILREVLSADGVRDRATVLFYARTNAVKLALAHSGMKASPDENATIAKRLMSPERLLQKVKAMNTRTKVGWVLSLIHI